MNRTRNNPYALAADAMVIARAPQPSVLLIRRGNPPYKGHWALPGGFLEERERLVACAARELAEETGLRVSPDAGTLVGIYDDPDRDPRGRVIGVVYLFVIDRVRDVKGGDDAAAARWFPLDALPGDLAFDHAQILEDGKQLYLHQFANTRKI